MLVWIDSNRKIIARNEVITKENAMLYLNDFCLWFDELEINLPNVNENEHVEMFLNADNTIKYVIEKNIIELSAQEQAILETNINVDYLICLADMPK